MASAPPATAPAARPRRPIEVAWHPGDWPSTAGKRWALRLLLTLPFGLLALYTAHRGYSSQETQLLLHNAESVRRGWGGGLSGTRDTYPAAVTAVLAAFPAAWRPAVLGAIGALASGVLCASLMARAVLRHATPWLVALALTGLVTNLTLGYVGTQDPSGMLALLFLVLALDGYMRFIAFGQTDGGFQAGLYLAAAFYCSPLALAYAPLLTVTAPLIARERFRTEADPRSAIGATVTVLVFPTAACVAGWTYVMWRLTGRPTGWFFDTWRREVFPHGPGAALVDTLRFMGELLWHSPLYIAACALAVTRSRHLLLAWFVPPAAILVSVWTGFPGARSVAHLLLLALALVLVPGRHEDRWLQTLFAVAAVAQVAANLVHPPSIELFWGWLDALGSHVWR